MESNSGWQIIFKLHTSFENISWLLRPGG